MNNFVEKLAQNPKDKKGNKPQNEVEKLLEENSKIKEELKYEKWSKNKIIFEKDWENL